jgi:hypothetical protein
MQLQHKKYLPQCSIIIGTIVSPTLCNIQADGQNCVETLVYTVYKNIKNMSLCVR